MSDTATVTDLTDIVVPRVAGDDTVKPRFTRDQQMLAEVESVYRRFMYLPNEHAYTVCALWVVHTHLRGNSGEFLPRTTPRLYFGSKQAGCGKTMALELTTLMSHNGAIKTEPTQPGLVTAINNDLATVGLDEVDLYFGSRGTANSGVRAILNTGYKRGATIDREHRGEVEKRNVHAPAAIAGKNANKFMTAESFETLRTRSIAVILDRKPVGHDVEKYRSERHEGFLRQVAGRLRRWGAQNGNVVTRIDVESVMPKGIDNRDEEIWQSLFQVAAFIGGRWPERIAKAAKALVLGQWDDDETPVLSPAETLLEAAKAAFEDDETFLPTSALLRRLMAVGGWWTEQWSSPRAASMDFASTMGTFGIEHTRGYIDGKQHRGYALADMLDVLDDSWADDEPETPDAGEWDWSELDD